MNGTDIIADLGAMTAIAQALEPLDDQAKGRVMAWATARFLGGSAAVPETTSGDAERVGEMETYAPKSVGTCIADFSDLAEFYHACGPSSDAEKALIVSGWFQAKEGLEGIDTFRVNSALKHLGFGIGNATRAFGALTAQRPASMIQLRKAGTTKQARKTFRVTDVGIRRIAQMLNTRSGEPS